MQTIWEAAARQQLASRIEAINAGSSPLWGRMNAEQMLAHLAASARMATGELKVRPKRTPFKWRPIRRLIIYRIPFPKGAPTAPELLAPVTRDLTEAKRDLVGLLDAVAAKGVDAEWPEHPAFGRLDGQEWGVVLYRHLDHHLRQFGA